MCFGVKWRRYEVTTMVSEHWFHFPQNHIQVFKTGIKQIQDPLMDPKQNNNNNLNIEGVVHAPWRHAAGAVQGATSASFLTPFRHH